MRSRRIPTREVNTMNTNAIFSPAECRVLERAARLMERGIKYAGAPILSDPTAVRRLLEVRMAGLAHEEFHALLLDSRNRLVEAVTLFKGTLSQTVVYPREVARAALAANAAAVIFAHNHPSGLAEPSHADRALTDALKRGLATLDIQVLDHFIVAPGARTYSFAENGLI